MKNEFLQSVIELLKTNREYPKYQMERRVDIFINLFLPDIIKWHFGPSFVTGPIIPELPLKKEGNFQSVNVDYFTICSAQKVGFLIELKTDARSIKAIQLERYLRVSEDGFKNILKGIRDITDSPNNKYRAKYNQLLKILQKDPNAQDIKLEIIYLIPNSCKHKLDGLVKRSSIKVHLITFDELRSLHPERFQKEWDLIFNNVFLS
jgi:hypothetical protein